jgi:hypothetical protein
MKKGAGSVRGSAVALGVLWFSSAAFGGFASTEVFLPAVGRVAGNGGAQFFTTVWATNLTGVTENFTFQFLKQGQANGSPASFSDTLAPGQTKVYENVVETKLGLASAIGAARVTSTGEIFVSERIFDEAPGADLGDTQGLFFAGVPKAFSISIGQSASIQGLNQGGAENFRYNFALVETTGAVATVNAQVFDGGGVLLGQKSFTLQPFEQLQPNVAEVVPGFSSINARITATVTGGMGSILMAGAQLANISQDSSGFEMSFRDDLLGGGGGAGVLSLNGLTGALTLTPGNGISITPSGSSINVAFTGGGSSGITSVTHDASLAGAGTGVSPLAIANGQVVRSLNGLHDALTLSAGTNVTITPSGNTLTIAATGGGGFAGVSHDATLVGTGAGASPLGVAVPLTLDSPSSNQFALHATMTNSGGNKDVISAQLAADAGGDTDSAALRGDAGEGIGVRGLSASGLGVSGQSAAGVGVHGESGSGIGVVGQTSTGDAGVIGVSGSGSGLDAGIFAGVVGDSNAANGVVGLTGSSPAGVVGRNKSAAADTSGVLGVDGTGVSGQSGSLSAGVYGESSSHVGVQGRTATGVAAVRGLNSSSTNETSGVFGRDGSGTSGLTNFPSTGIRGESATHIGVMGLTKTGAGVLAALNSIADVQAELATDREEGHTFAVYTFGDVKFLGTMTATGTKAFVEPHPTDATKEIRFVCLEGPESGTYFRGSGHVVGGFAKIPVPESFRDVTDESGLTIVATPVGGPGSIWVVKKSLDAIVLQANADVDFDYVVNGVRRAYRDFEAIHDNETFVPDGPDDRRFALYAPEIQRRLVATGIYNPNGTVNLETAKRLGWDRKWDRGLLEPASP